MNRTKRLCGSLGIVLCSSLLGSAAYGQAAVSVGVSVPLPAVEVVVPVVEIRAESDFYEPLTPLGEWVVVDSYGRCWRPARVEAGWRPYCNGNWQRTEAGWYWVSDEPWGWATYHYGRWDFTDQYGWYWVPQTQWAPAWVSWHEGGGYIGWAPLQPAVRVSASGFVGFNVALIPPRAFVFVEQRQFLDPIRPTIVVVNNTTVINKTTSITTTKLVNNAVINEGPATAVIEKASGRKVEAVPVKELRHKTEAAVVTRQRLPASASEKAVPPAEKKTIPPGEPAQVQKPGTIPHEPGAPVLKNDPAPGEPHKGVESKPAVKPEKPEIKPPAIKDPPGQGPDQQPDKKDPPPGKDKPPGNGRGGGNPADKDQEPDPKN